MDKNDEEMKQKWFASLAFSIGLLISLTGNSQELIKLQSLDQNYDQAIDAFNFKQDMMQYLVINEINVWRKKNFTDEFAPENTLNELAITLAKSLLEADLAKPENSDELFDLLSEKGLTDHVKFVTARYPSKKEGIPYSYSQLAKDLLAGWLANTKTAEILWAQPERFAGLGAEISDDGKKIYFYLLLGSYRSFDLAPDFSSMDVPPTTKLFGLSDFDESICKKINKYQVHKIQQSIQPEGDEIYLKSNDLKLIKRIIKAESKDGLAIDIVQKEQYPMDGDNMIDLSNPNRGILIKPVFADDLYNNNEIEGKEAKKSIKVYLGTIPEGISAYEINTVIIKDNCYCRTLQPSFLPDKGFSPFQEIEFLADTVSLGSKINFIPESVEDEYMFRFPFVDKVETYKYEDFLPFLKDFDVPPYIVNELSIAAFTSCDQSDNRDMIQIHKKSAEITKAFQSNQAEKIKSDIVTSNGWTLFRDDVIGTKYENLAFLDQRQAVQSFGPYLKEPEFQAILAKHRFAQIQMYVSYDIRGSKEQDYAIYHFNKAVEKNNPQLALAIQKFIMKNIMTGKYTDAAIINQKIPLKQELTGLMMNKLWLQKKYNLIDDELFHAGMVKLFETDQNNPYIRFNYLNSEIHQKGITEEMSIFKLQSSIDKLYKSTITQPTLDALNLDFQFNLIRALDSITTASDYLTPALEKVKNLTKLSSNSEKSALELAYLFIKYDDFTYANQLLRPFLFTPGVSEDVVFTYLSTATFIPGEYYTGSFEKAFELATLSNPKRLKELIAKYKISITIAENPVVKKMLAKL